MPDIQIPQQSDSCKTLLYLAARCEAATGPDRDLDAAVIVQAFGWRYKLTFLREEFWHRNGERLYRQQIPLYTASLDTAMTLVPEGWLSVQVGHTDDGRGYASLARNDGHMMAEDPHEFWVGADSATPALALTAAAIRARAAMT